MPRLMLVLSILAVSVSTANAQTELNWKFKQGDQFYMLEVSETKQKLSVMGQVVNQATTNISITSLTVDNIAADGTIRMSMKLEKVTGKGDKVDPNMNRRIEGSTFAIELDKQLKITKFSGYDEFIKRVSDGNEALARAVRPILNEELLKRPIENLFHSTPPKPVESGDKWTRSDELSLGPIGSVAVTQECTYGGEVVADGKKIHRIDAEGSGKYNAPGPNGPGGLAFQIVRATFKFDKITGQFDFEKELGRARRGMSSVEASGNMTIKIGGTEQTVDIDMTQSTRFTVHDKMPALPE